MLQFVTLVFFLNIALVINPVQTPKNFACCVAEWLNSSSCKGIFLTGVTGYKWAFTSLMLSQIKTLYFCACTRLLVTLVEKY